MRDMFEKQLKDVQPEKKVAQPDVTSDPVKTVKVKRRSKKVRSLKLAGT